MQSLLLANNSRIDNVGFAAPNSIDGRLTVWINADATKWLQIVQEFTASSANLETIQVLNESGQTLQTYCGFSRFSQAHIDGDAGTLCVWLRKGA